MSWLAGWTYRRSHTINPASNAGENYQKRIVVHYGIGVDSDEDVYLDGKCKTDFGDVRFADNTGVVLLDYWVEKKVDSDYAICWIEVIENLSVYYKRTYIYYGNVVATSVANGDNTFIFFDDFESGLSKWVGIGKQEGPYTALANQHKIVQTADGTIHTVSISCFSAGSGTSTMDIYSSRDSGVTWESLNFRLWTPGQLNFPAIAKDSSDNLYIAYGYLAGGADGRIRFKKATVNKTNPILWTWSLGSEISIDATITDGGVPDIIVDSNNYIHVVYCRTLINKSRWARSIDGGTTWIREEITIPGGVYQGYMVASIDKDSQNNLYFGMGPLFVGSREFKFYVEKVDYIGGTTWSQNTLVEVSSDVSTIGQLNVLPNDRICVIYGLKNDPGVYFRKTTLPRDTSAWGSEVFVGESTGPESRNSSLSFTDSDNMKVVFLSPLLHPTTYDIALTESSDGGATWSVPVLLTDSPIPSRYPASLRTTVLGDMFFVWGDYTDWESKYGNLWFRSTGELDSVMIYGSSPVIATDYAYSGEKCLRFTPLITASISKLQTPYDNKAVHVHFYDQVSAQVEYSIFSTDVGEPEVSYVGIINDIGHYEYKLQGTVYDSGIDRSVGWHEFVVRSSGGLKQFIIDNNLMPITGIGNYNPTTYIFGINTSAVYSYWDTVFQRKFVNPEPSHGDWGIEQTEAPTIYTAEDVENAISGPHQGDEIINSLTQKATRVDDLIFALLSSPHIPIVSAEDIIKVMLATRCLLTNELIWSLVGSHHTPIMSSEDIIVSLLAKRLLLSEDIIIKLLAQRLLQGQDIIYTRPLLYRALMMAYPIFGGSHIIQVRDED